MPVFNTDFVARRATNTELVALRNRMTSLMRPGAVAQELAQAALEYFYYVHLNATHAQPLEPLHKAGAPNLHSLSSATPVHNAPIPNTLSMLHHMRG
jgi:hypothetical protein